MWKDQREACRSQTEAPRSSQGGRLWWAPDCCLGAGSEGAWGTPLQVQHLQKELNTRLPGNFARTATPPAQLWRADLSVCLGYSLSALPWREVHCPRLGHSQFPRTGAAWWELQVLGVVKAYMEEWGKLKIQPRLPQETPNPQAMHSQSPRWQRLSAPHYILHLFFVTVWPFPSSSSCSSLLD